MGRPISERVRDPKWWGEQVAHLLIGFAFSGLVAGLLGYLATVHLAGAAVCGTIVGTAAGCGWELGQNVGDAPEVGSQVDSIIDLGVWAIGAALGPLVLLAA